MKIRKERTHATNFSSMLKNYFTFYKKNLRRKHMIIYILSLVLFAFFITSFKSDLTAMNQLLSQIGDNKEETNIFMLILRNKIPLAFLLTFSGVTPYIYIPMMGIIGVPYLLALGLMNMSVVSLVISCIGAIIQIFGYSLAIAGGIYYCNLSTKRYRYNQTNLFGLDDIKMQIYEATKKEEKLNKVKERRQAKIEKKEKLNVKIEYKKLLITVIVSIIIVVIATLITGA